ncbi:Aste57867_16433 [Aphanomyces stellatus]|uniref:Aste57867_16433 protein n=1 Tax=Aphanomyces stellatus TaxID=120398 RepID=A0A485L6P1_9STRA|nr:hypothetical protein As57867_016376 [Aphanomyces stellatus]VFT93208.1 Aste57867_16433 [Aphanomyces stellatus]
MSSPCSQCYTLLPPKTRFCISCGAIQPSTPSPPPATSVATASQTCGKCGAVAGKMKFCPSCGEPCRVISPSINPAPGLHEPPRAKKLDMSDFEERMRQQRAQKDVEDDRARQIAAAKRAAADAKLAEIERQRQANPWVPPPQPVKKPPPPPPVEIASRRPTMPSSSTTGSSLVCRQCGTNTANMKFCPSCGALASSAPSSRAWTPPPSSTYVPPPASCPKCGTHAPTMKFCPTCGEPNAATTPPRKVSTPVGDAGPVTAAISTLAVSSCPQCSTNAAGMKFCPSCGTAILAKARTPPALDLFPTTHTPAVPSTAPVMPSATSPTTRCTQCGTDAVGMKFCPSCGTIILAKPKTRSPPSVTDRYTKQPPPPVPSIAQAASFGAVAQPTMTCPQCGTHATNIKFCPSCGTSMQRTPPPKPRHHSSTGGAGASSLSTCRGCGADATKMKFCPSCGTPTMSSMVAVAQAVPPAAVAAAASQYLSAMPPSTASSTLPASIAMVPSGQHMAALASAAAATARQQPQHTTAARSRFQPPTTTAPPTTGFVQPEDGSGHVYTMTQTVTRSVTYNA